MNPEPVETPAYEKRLAARHAVFDEIFTEIVDGLPLAEDHRVLDAGCGDGYFLVKFLSRPKRVNVTGLDPSAAYLKLAESACRGHFRAALLKGVAEHIPCAPETFNLVWSAHSMQSYDNVEAALREFYGVLKPGGTVAILENDRLHARLLPLPPRLEIALLRREIEAVHARTATGLFYPRWSDRMLHEAGFVNLRRKTYTFERQAPWDEEEQGYYELMLEDALEGAREHLNGGLLADAERLLSPSSTRYLGASELRFFSEFHTLFLGNKPEES